MMIFRRRSTGRDCEISRLEICLGNFLQAFFDGGFIEIILELVEDELVDFEVEVLFILSDLHRDAGFHADLGLGIVHGHYQGHFDVAPVRVGDRFALAGVSRFDATKNALLVSAEDARVGVDRALQDTLQNVGIFVEGFYRCREHAATQISQRFFVQSSGIDLDLDSGGFRNVELGVEE